jgi:hypothetical protein
MRRNKLNNRSSISALIKSSRNLDDKEEIEDIRRINSVQVLVAAVQQLMPRKEVVADLAVIEIGSK